MHSSLMQIPIDCISVPCQHPYIVPSVNSVATEAGVCVVRPWFPQVRNLRDKDGLE